METTLFLAGNPAVVVNDDGGSFVGTITDVNDVRVIVTPSHPAVRYWYPKGYDVGRAHWGHYVKHAQGSDVKLVRELEGKK